MTVKGSHINQTPQQPLQQDTTTSSTQFMQRLKVQRRSTGLQVEQMVPAQLRDDDGKSLMLIRYHMVPEHEPTTILLEESNSDDNVRLHGTVQTNSHMCLAFSASLPHPLVIMGRGNQFATHQGNIRFYEVIDQYTEAYFNAHSKFLKTRVVQQIFKELSKYGRFLRRDAESKEFYQISNVEAKQKISHAVRYRYKNNPPENDSVASRLTEAAVHSVQTEELKWLIESNDLEALGNDADEAFELLQFPTDSDSIHMKQEFPNSGTDGLFSDGVLHIVHWRL